MQVTISTAVVPVQCDELATHLLYLVDCYYCVACWAACRTAAACVTCTCGVFLGSNSNSRLFRLLILFIWFHLRVLRSLHDHHNDSCVHVTLHVPCNQASSCSCRCTACMHVISVLIIIYYKCWPTGQQVAAICNAIPCNTCSSENGAAAARCCLPKCWSCP